MVVETIIFKYNFDQKKVDESLQSMLDFILEVASEEKLKDIKAQLEVKLETSNA